MKGLEVARVMLGGWGGEFAKVLLVKPDPDFVRFERLDTDGIAFEGTAYSVDVPLMMDAPSGADFAGLHAVGVVHDARCAVATLGGTVQVIRDLHIERLVWADVIEVVLPGLAGELLTL